MPLVIRDATHSDEVQVLELFSKLPSRQNTSEYLVDQSLSSRIYRKILNDLSLGVVIVAELGSKLLGVITLSYPVAIRRGGHYSRIEEYIVDESFRGMRIGSKLLDAAIKAAQEHGCYDIQVNNPSDLGKPLYDKRGFKDGGEYWRLKL
jgi:ribosomal protein S18 acetylase RimI-like enzyme